MSAVQCSTGYGLGFGLGWAGAGAGAGLETRGDRGGRYRRVYLWVGWYLEGGI